MIELEQYCAHLVVLFTFFMLVVDRFLWRRGHVDIQNAKEHGIAGGLIRFSLDFIPNSIPLWSKVTYRLVDKNNPSTVIHGRAKPLEICGCHQQSEYLFLTATTLATGEWNLYVQVETVASRFNFLYRLFPCQTSYCKEVDITCNNPARPAPVAAMTQPYGEIAPQEIMCADTSPRSALVEVFIAKNGAIYGRTSNGCEPFVIGAWNVEDTPLEQLEFRVNHFFSMGSGKQERKTAGKATNDWVGFKGDATEVFLMSCSTDYVAFGRLSGVSTGSLEIKKKGVEGIACSSQLTIMCG